MHTKRFERLIRAAGCRVSGPIHAATRTQGRSRIAFDLLDLPSQVRSRISIPHPLILKSSFVPSQNGDSQLAIDRPWSLV